jgi:probable F420-dependent oxidoreductase
MRIGLSTPVVVQFPGGSAPWEREARPDDLVSIAKAADELGFDHLTCSEHVAIPASVASQRGSVYWDPLATLSYLAAHTRSIRLATSILVLGYHHPLELAKRYGTLDRLSGGRVVLGVGIGSLQEEFELLGASWKDRAARADDALRALRASLSRPDPSYNGSHFDFEGFVVEPHAVQEHLPMWVGGRSLRSLQRATTLANGWVPFGLSAEALGDMLAQAELPEGFELVLSPGRPVDPVGDPDPTIRALVDLCDVGATVANVALIAESRNHYLDQMAALCKLSGEIG